MGGIARIVMLTTLAPMTPVQAARCPPADPTIATILAGSMPSVWFTSWIVSSRLQPLWRRVFSRSVAFSFFRLFARGNRSPRVKW